MDKGFTIIELLVTVSIVGILASLGIAFSFDNYRFSLFQNDIELLEAILVKTRTDSIIAKDSKGYGLKIEPGKIIVFGGSHYQAGGPENETFPTSLRLEGTNDSQIAFEPVTGSVLIPRLLTLTNGNNKETITINAEGAIEYR